MWQSPATVWGLGGSRAKGVGVAMRRSVFLGAVLAAGLLVGSGTASADPSGPEDEGQSADVLSTEVLRDLAQPAHEDPGLAAAASPAGDGPEARAAQADPGLTSGLCFSQQFSDPDEPGDGVLDVVSYEMAFDCSSLRFVTAITIDPSSLGQIWSYRVAFDIDGDLSDGCGGAEYTAYLLGDEDPASPLRGGFLRHSDSCSGQSIGGVVYHRPTETSLVVRIEPQSFEPMGWPGQVLRWQQSLRGQDPDVTDLLPDGLLANGQYQSTPAHPCSGHCFYLTNQTTGGSPETTFLDAQPGSEVLVGDWNADDVDSFGFRSGSAYSFKNAHAPGPPELTFSYGRSTDAALAGDWDGDGDDTLGLRRGNTYHLKNSLSGGAADVTFTYGRADDTVLVGDWDGDGVSTLAVRRGNTYYIKNTLGGGSADIVVSYGQATDTSLVGDWDGDGDDTLGLRRYDLPASYYLKNSFGSGAADVTFTYNSGTGSHGEISLAGDWNGDGTDTVGARL